MTTTTRTPKTPQEIAAELADFQRKVREEIIKAGKHRGDYTRDQQNKTLAELGLAPIYEPRYVPVEITTTKRTTIQIDDAPTLEEARAKVAAMGHDEIVAKLRSPGGYVSHRVLTADEAGEEDPLSWIVENHAECVYGGSRYREAVRAVRDERDSDGGLHCRAYSPNGTYHCSRGRDHVGPHIAATSDGICTGGEGIWPRGTSHGGGGED